RPPGPPPPSARSRVLSRAGLLLQHPDVLEADLRPELLAFDLVLLALDGQDRFPLVELEAEGGLADAAPLAAARRVRARGAGHLPGQRDPVIARGLERAGHPPRGRPHRHGNDDPDAHHPRAKTA